MVFAAAFFVFAAKVGYYHAEAHGSMANILPPNKDRFRPDSHSTNKLDEHTIWQNEA